MRRLFRFASLVKAQGSQASHTSTQMRGAGVKLLTAAPETVQVWS